MLHGDALGRKGADDRAQVVDDGDPLLGRRDPEPHQHEVPPRVEYALTAKGEALAPLIEDMRAYGTRWLLDEAGVPAEPAAA